MFVFLSTVVFWLSFCIFLGRTKVRLFNGVVTQGYTLPQGTPHRIAHSFVWLKCQYTPKRGLKTSKGSLWTQPVVRQVIATKLFGGTMLAVVGPQLWPLLRCFCAYCGRRPAQRFFYAYLAIVLVAAWEMLLDCCDMFFSLGNGRLASWMPLKDIITLVRIVLWRSCRRHSWPTSRFAKMQLLHWLLMNISSMSHLCVCEGFPLSHSLFRRWAPSPVRQWRSCQSCFLRCIYPNIERLTEAKTCVCWVLRLFGSSWWYYQETEL